MKKRVEIPTNKGNLLKLAQLLQAKHVEDGATSPLSVLKWETITPLIEQASARHETAERLKRDMANEYQQRDLMINTIINLVRSSRDILSGVYPNEMKKLGKWGFNVLDNHRASSAGSEAEEQEGDKTEPQE